MDDVKLFTIVTDPYLIESWLCNMCNMYIIWIGSINAWARVDFLPIQIFEVRHRTVNNATIYAMIQLLYKMRMVARETVCNRRVRARGTTLIYSVTATEWYKWHCVSDAVDDNATVSRRTSSNAGDWRTTDREGWGWGGAVSTWHTARHYVTVHTLVWL